MNIIIVPFSAKTLNKLAPLSPLLSVQEYKDANLHNLHLLQYKNKLTFVFKCCHHYTQIKERLGHYPQLSVADAKKLVLERIQALECGQYVIQRKMTVDVFFNDYYMVDMSLNKRNTASELSKCRRYLLPQFGNRTLLSINSSELSKYFLQLREQLSVATVNRIISIFKKLFTLAIEHGYLIRSPALHIRLMAENNYRHKVLTNVQAKTFLTICQSLGTKHAIALYLSLTTGMRIGEVISLRMSDVNLIDGEIVLRATKNGSTHIVPITKAVIETLVEYVKTYSPTEFLFSSNRTATGYISSPRSTFAAILARMGLTNEGLYIHDLRRTFATSVLEQTNDIQLVSQLLNHNSLAMTQRYARFNTSSLKARVQYLNLYRYEEKNNALFN